MEAFFQDLTHSLRMLRHNKTFTLTAILALALGIGVNSAIFSIVNAVLLKPEPLPDPDRLVIFMNTPGPVRFRPRSLKFTPLDIERFFI